MKILKRNQLIVLVISLMLITAGYLNFTSSQKNIETSAIADRDDESIGDAQLVSTIPSNNEEERIENLLNGETTSVNEEEITTSNTTENKDYYFTTSKLDRNTMYSELLETYQEMYNNNSATAEQKAEALAKINEINTTKNALMISENLIMAKGFENVVIFVNDQSISVVVKTNELKQEDVAQIQNIFLRFHITCSFALILYMYNSIKQISNQSYQ